MKKSISVLLGILMLTVLISCLCISAAAARQDITFVSIDGVVAPVVGQKPTYSAKNSQNTDYFDVTNIQNDGTTIINGVGWYDVTEQRAISSDEKFKAGHEYTVTVYLCANDGYIFPETIYELFINNKAAYGTLDYEHADSQMKATQFSVYYTFPELAAQTSGNAVNSVNIETSTRINSLGELVSFDASGSPMANSNQSIDTSYNQDGFINGIKWVTGKGKTLVKGHRYYPRTEYYLSLCLVPAKGKTFDNGVMVTIDGNEASVIDFDSKRIIVEYYMYPMGYGNDGWYKTTDGKYLYCYDDSGHFYRNQFGKIIVKEKAYYYYFDNYGFRVTGWKNIKRSDGKTYKHYFNPNGTMARGWASIKNSKGVAYKYYFGTNGCMRTGWQSIKNSKGVAYKYYFHTNGVMLTNWQWIANSKGVKYRYYFGPNGYVRTGWQKLQASNGKYYWYYFFSNGVNAINRSVKIGTKTYKFNKYGICTNP